jgi:hypothetical protein
MSKHRLLIALLLFFSTGLSAHASNLTINITFDSTITSDPRAAQIESAVNYVVMEYQTLFTNPITVNITVSENSSVGLGESDTNLTGAFTYSQIRSALINDATSADDIVALDADTSLPTTDPTSSNNYFVPTAEAKALGLLGESSSSDGTFLFNSTDSYTFDPNNQQVAGDFDFIGIAEHEISEIMGRISGLGTTSFNGKAAYLPFDLFRYSAPGVRAYNNNGSTYLSIDGGNTDLQGFNDAATNGGDPQDFNGSNPSDPYNAFTGPDQGHSLTAVDLDAMNVIGYNTIVPEPSTGILMSVAFLVAAGLTRRRATVR